MGKDVIVLLLVICFGINNLNMVNDPTECLGIPYNTLKEQYYSDNLKKGDIFTWQINKFIFNGEIVNSSEITRNNVTEGSMIQLFILKDFANYDVLNDTWVGFREHFNITIDNSIYYNGFGDIIEYGIMMSEGWGWGFPIVRPILYVYESGAVLSLSEQIERQLGDNDAYDLKYNETILTMTHNSTKEVFVFNATTGILLSYHEINKNHNFECSLILIDNETRNSSSSSTTPSTVKSTYSSTTSKNIETGTSNPLITSSNGLYTVTFALLTLVLIISKRKRR